MNCLGSWKAAWSVQSALRACAFVVVPWLFTAGTVAAEMADFDGDGIVDSIDADQDNDGLLNAEEGLVMVTQEALSQPVGYLFASEDTPDILGQGQRGRYRLQRPYHRLWFTGEVIGSAEFVNWQQIDGLVKVQHARAGETTLEWTLRQRTGAIQPFDIDIKISDLDVERQEAVSVEKASIVGYSLTDNTAVDVSESDSRITFAAIGDHGANTNAVVLHVRDRHRLRIRYHNSAPKNASAGIRAGFIHSFDTKDINNYTMMISMRDTDLDGMPDHRDTDRDNDGVADVVEAGYVEDEADVAAIAVDEFGKPVFPGSLRVGHPPDQEFDSDRDGLRDRQEWYLGTDVSDFDTDNDGFGDGEEVTVFHSDPLDANSFPSSGAQTDMVEDHDRDGIPDHMEGYGDLDGDGIPDNYDLDSDNDGLPDRVEGLADTDGDGLADLHDLDSDDDGYFDLIEAGYGDFDKNGVVDRLVDDNTNGWHDALEAPDFQVPDQNQDGVPDFRDSAVQPVLEGAMLNDAAGTQRENTGGLATGVGGAGCAMRPQGRDASMVLLSLLVVLYGSICIRRRSI
jgi:hypothetical protein